MNKVVKEFTEYIKDNINSGGWQYALHKEEFDDLIGDEVKFITDFKPKIEDILHNEVKIWFDDLPVAGVKMLVVRGIRPNKYDSCVIIPDEHQ